MTATFLVGDVYQRMRELEDHSFDLIITSPPFLALRSYLPDGHPDKNKEIGSEATPAEFLYTLLALTAEWRRLLAPHGSIAIELGDTYAGSGGAGGAYLEGGMREGQPGMDGSAVRRRAAATARQTELLNTTYEPTATGKYGNRIRDKRRSQTNGNKNRDNAEGWPLDKSLTGIPTLYAWSLAYGRNLLTGQPSPACRWRIRNLKPWIRSNPPVGALGDKERPATSYITVACTGRDRWFDLDAVRTRPSQDPATYTGNGYTKGRPEGIVGNEAMAGNPGGAPPLDWWHQIDALIDNEIDERPGARGVHIRRRLETAGYLHTQDAYDVSPRGYAGAHYAVWPPELVRLMIDEMCPRRVCVVCGQPSRRIVGEASYIKPDGRPHQFHGDGFETNESLANRRKVTGHDNGNMTAQRPTLGWSDCGHNTWRPGRILDPFVGSGTTLAVASGMGRDSVGIDLDGRNAHLAEQRVGMFLTVDWGNQQPTTELPPDSIDIIPAEDSL